MLIKKSTSSKLEELMQKRFFPIKMILIFLIFYSILFGALPPTVLMELQNNSKECFEIKVINIKNTTVNEREIAVIVTAIILKKYRSDIDFKKGDAINIKYNTYKAIVNQTKEIAEDIEGPLPIPVLEKNKKYDAFLKLNNDKSLSPNAGCLSFIEKVVKN